MRVKLSSMPDPKSQSSVSLSNLYGGLNLDDDPVNVTSKQSPDMLNMWYRDGVLQKRGGYKNIFGASRAGASSLDSGKVWFYDRLFGGMVVYVDGTSIRYFNPYLSSPVLMTVSGTSIPSGIDHGMFFPFDDSLYYKASGIYIKLTCSSGTITAENILTASGGTYTISDSVYTPIIAINRNPDGSGGSLYQPENRINPKKSVWFDIDDKSYDYYLPVHGCKVTKIRIGDDEVSTTGTSRVYTVGGRIATISNESVADDSSEYTKISFDIPLYIDETGWTENSWVSTPSGGWNYLKNIVYSNMDIPVNDDTNMIGGTVVRAADSATVPSNLSQTFADKALSMCPYNGATEYLVLDNGQWMNFMITRTGSPSFNLYNYDNTTTEFWTENYYWVSYEYATGEWKTHDLTGQKDSGWHYTKNIVYASCDLTYNGATIRAKGGSTSQYNMYGYSIASLALEYSGLSSSADGYSLLWVSENDQYWVFHYLVGSNKFIVTGYDADSGIFYGKGIRLVTIYKNNLYLKSVEDQTASSVYGFYVKNIIWASQPIMWNTYIPGDNLVKLNSGTLPSTYKKYVETALARARRDYPDAGLTGKYAVAASGKYISVYLDAGIKLASYNLGTGEFTASGFVSEAYTVPSGYDGISISASTPAVLSNKLRVEYTKDNADAMKSISDCLYACSFGGSDAVCVVMGCCEGQPNAIFWSGNGSYGVDATYFPMDQYNLCGVSTEPVSGFGKQQNVLVVFQPHHTSKATYGITETSGRKFINLTLSTINAERGCDLPWSICLCGNNLVWMHTKHGVMYLKDTSSAYENMIVVISGNVNGSSDRPGILYDIGLSDAKRCFGMDDGQRYYAFANGNLYVWDYTIASVSDGIKSLSWTRHSPFSMQAAAECDTGSIWMLGGNGALYQMKDTITTDCGALIQCHYRTPTEAFGGYYKTKNVNKIMLSVWDSGNDPVTVTYGGEGHEINNQVYVPIQTDGTEFCKPVILKPRGLHVYHFWLQIASSGTLSIGNIVILYTSQSLSK